jgi:hypothetical protein
VRAATLSASYCKVKLARYTPWRRLGGEELRLLLILNLGMEDGGELSASRPGCALPPGKGPRYPLDRRLGGPLEPVWMQRLEEKSSVGDRTPVVQSVVRHYTD